MRIIRGKHRAVRAMLAAALVTGLTVTESAAAPVTEADAEQAVIGWVRLNETLGPVFGSGVET